MSDQVLVSRLQNDKDVQQAFCCMSEVPTPWPQALGVCRAWVSQNLGQHVEGYHLQDVYGSVIGQLYYALSEQALVPYEIEPGVAVMYCEWIHRQHQKKGLGRHLFGAFEQDMRERECKGILIEGTDREEQMYYRHYLARGFEVVYEAGDRRLLYLPLNQPQVKLQPLEPRIQPRRVVPVEILVLSGYLCPFEASTQMLLLGIVQEFGDRVILREESLTHETLRRYGVAEGIFINGRRKLAGAPTEQAIRQAIIEEL